MAFSPKFLLTQLFSSATAADSIAEEETFAISGVVSEQATKRPYTADDSITTVAEGCENCKVCVRTCHFLQKHGTPGKICQQSRSEADRQTPVFECTLCRLCESVCPKYLPIATAFLDIRKKVQRHDGKTPAKNPVDPRHNRLCTYEKIGTSRLLSLFHLPEGGDTVFFPGCTLAATRSEVTLKTFSHLQKMDSRCGIVLDCCSKPSHDLGLTGKFEQSFCRLADKLRKNGVKNIITACPSCYVTLKKYLPECHTSTVYEELAHTPPSLNDNIDETFVIHDPCTCRGESQIHHGVRTLIASTGVRIREAEHSRGTALCCGEGGAAAYISPDLSAQWKTLRKNEAAGNRVITYCAGCASTFGRTLSTTHLLDLLFTPDKAESGDRPQIHPLFSTMKRLLLKWRIRFGR